MFLCLKINDLVDFAGGSRLPVKQNIGRRSDMSLYSIPELKGLYFIHICY